ncbi:MAG: hypothetical protein R3217_07440 [Gammaproteobacteria bacterium]|nr:hypothetical protein [Gammaproteobacteria bacterium]
MDFMQTKRMLNLTWYGTLLGAIGAFTAAIHFFVIPEMEPPQVDDSLLNMMPIILGAATAACFGGSLFLKHGWIEKRAISMAGTSHPDMQLKTLTMIQLGAADAPCIVGLGFYLLIQQEWLAYAIVGYAVVAALLFKPDFVRLYALLRSSPTN